MKKIFLAGAALAAFAAMSAEAGPGKDGERSAQPMTRADAVARVQARFDRVDANRDGFITEEEVRAAAEARRSERGGERSAHRRGGMMMAGFGPRAFAATDLDRDGRISLAEAQRAALQRFDRVDSNRDGTISPDERQAARAARMERREDGRDD